MSIALLNIGQKIKKERLKQKITIAKLIKDLNLAHKYLNQIETGKLDETVNVITISRYLKLYFQYLNMDEKSLLQEYQDQYNQEHQIKDAHIIEKDNFIYPQKHIIKLTIALLIFLLFIIQLIEPKNNKNLLEKLSTEKNLLLK